MKLRLTAMMLAGVFLFGCSGSGETEASRVFVAIEPLVWFARELAPEGVEVEVMVPRGKSPATYDPSPRQMSRLSEADLYFSLDMPFEANLLPQMESMMPGLRVVDAAEGIFRRQIDSILDIGEGHDHEGHDHEGHDHEGHDHVGSDPHVWLNPINGVLIAETMAYAMIEKYPGDAEGIGHRLEEIREILVEIDDRIEKNLTTSQAKGFLVFHPSFGYFADRYGLVQYSIEVGGREPSPRELQEMLEIVQGRHLDVLLVQNEFPRETAESIGRTLSLRVRTADPLNSDYPEIFRELEAFFEVRD